MSFGPKIAKEWYKNLFNLFYYNKINAAEAPVMNSPTICVIIYQWNLKSSKAILLHGTWCQICQGVMA